METKAKSLVFSSLLTALYTRTKPRKWNKQFCANRIIVSNLAGWNGGHPFVLDNFQNISLLDLNRVGAGWVKIGVSIQVPVKFSEFTELHRRYYVFKYKLLKLGLFSNFTVLFLTVSYLAYFKI